MGTHAGTARGVAHRALVLVAGMLGSAAQPVMAAAVGDLDPGFHGNGLRALALDGGGANNDFADAVAVLPDGRILVAGWTQRGPGFDDAAFVTRLEPDGSIDFGFGAAGTALVDFGGAEVTSDRVRDLAVDGAGRIILAGSTYHADQDRADFAVARLLPDGALDPAFGTGGRVVIDFFGASPVEELLGVAVQPDGAIVLAGASQVADEVALVAVRLLDSGAPDPGFSGDGIAAYALGGGIPSASAASSIVLLPDGRLLLGGVANTSTDGSYNVDMLLLRLRPDGSRDASFGEDGVATLGLDRGGGDVDRAFAMVVQESGRIVLAGSSTKAGGDFDMALAGFLADGRLDTGFGDGGARVLALDRGGSLTDLARTLVRLPDDGLVVAGSSDSDAGDEDVAIVALDADGLGGIDQLRVHAPDRGTQGARNDSAEAAALVADGSIVLGGYSEANADEGSTFDALVLRVLGPALFGSGFEE